MWGAASPAWDWDVQVSLAQPSALPRSLGLREDLGHGQAGEVRGPAGALHPGSPSLGNMSLEPLWFLGTAANCPSPLGYESLVLTGVTWLWLLLVAGCPCHRVSWIVASLGWAPGGGVRMLPEWVLHLCLVPSLTAMAGRLTLARGVVASWAGGLG